MGSKKFTKWLDEKNHKTSFKIIQTYYIQKEQGLKTGYLPQGLLLLFLKRLIYVFFNLFRFNRNPYPKYLASPNIKHFFKRLLGLYKLEVKGLLPSDPVLNPLVFESQAAPVVSIIIAVHNHFNYTYNCLHSILLNTSNVNYEIVLINDCSSDNTAQHITKIKNITYLENKENLGFLRSCNKAAKSARGKYLCFLNNDTQVKSNWLYHMLAVFTTDKDAGIVGAKLIFPYGLLQEAGGLVDSQGYPTNYGRYQLPDQTQFNYLRETDYCSGACLLLPKKSFEVLNGFDERYIPAYYEDTDLCISIKYKLGKKVYFQPLAEVIHFEGVSSGKIIKPGNVKSYQSVNAEKFKVKWNEVFKKFPVNLSDDKIAEKFDKTKTVLFIDATLPTYDKDSGSKRMYELLRIFKSLNYNLLFLPHNAEKPEPYYSELITLGVRMLYPTPFSDPDLLTAHESMLNKVNIVWLSRPYINQIYIPYLQKYTSMIWAYDTVDLHFIREERRLQLQETINAEEIKLIEATKAEEIQLSKDADITIAITKVEAEILIRNGAKKVSVIPNIHKPYEGKKKSFYDRKGICFIGGYYHDPNVDAMIWLVNDIMPLIWITHPDITVTIMGSYPTPEVLKLQSTKVKVTGYLEDISENFTSSKIFVAPLRYGAGMKGKIGQSLEFGLPVITTDIGAEGMDLTHGHDVLIANTKEEFAREIISLYDNEMLWNNLAINSFAAIEKYSPENVSREIEQIFE